MRAGELLGPYGLRREIGEGGIAEVFIAEHAPTKAGVVLKALRPEHVSHAETLAIFLGEPRALQSVEHENTLQVTDVVASGAQPYFVTELLRGRTLAELLRHGRLPLPRAMHIARQVATVLAHAHDVDVVHRNLKPANVFLVRRESGQPDFVKLLELGAVRMQSLGAKPVAGTLIGTPAYMAPEQLRQTAGDTRVDMYSFGVLLYELTIGWKPFVGEVADIVRQHLLERAPRARAIAPDTPEVLDALIAQCLEKDPDARPPSMHEVSLALAALADSLGPLVIEDEGPGPSVAVPKNTSGYTTVPADVTVAPAPVMSFDEDEPSFETVTGKWTVHLAPEPISLPPSAPVSAAPPASAAAPSPASTPRAQTSSTPPAPARAPTPAPLFTFDEAQKIDPAPRSADSAPRSRAPLFAAAVGVVVVVAAFAWWARPTEPGAPALADANVVPAPIPAPPPPEPSPPEPPPPAVIDAGVEPTHEEAATADAGSAPRHEYPVAFSSTPSGAQVWIRMDRRIRLLCTTPCTFTLPAGRSVLVELRLDGYVSAQRTLTVADGAGFNGTLRPAR